MCIFGWPTPLKVRWTMFKFYNILLKKVISNEKAFSSLHKYALYRFPRIFCLYSQQELQGRLLKKVFFQWQCEFKTKWLFHLQDQVSKQSGKHIWLFKAQNNHSLLKSKCDTQRFTFAAGSSEVLWRLTHQNEWEREREALKGQQTAEK